MPREYTRQLTARQLIEYIANDYMELSYEKVIWQRNDYIKACRDWLEHHPEVNENTNEYPRTANTNFDF